MLERLSVDYGKKSKISLTAAGLNFGITALVDLAGCVDFRQRDVLQQANIPSLDSIAYTAPSVIAC